jgi:hypothetical protein
MASLDEKIATYTAQIQKIGDLSLLSKIKKAQDDSKAAAKKARILYEKFLDSKKDS